MISNIADIAYGQKWIKSAPFLIVLVTKIVSDEAAGGISRNTVWISYFDVKKLAELLALPSDHIPSEIIAFGYPAKERTFSRKKDLADIVFYNKYK